MPVTNVGISRPFLSEVQWVKQSIAQINEYRSKNWAIGLNGDTAEPDGFTASFAERELVCAAYIRNFFPVGSTAAYDQNITTLVNYIERERAEEISSITNMITQINDYHAKNWAIGLNWPDGQPDGFSRYFAVRGLKISFYLRGNISVGDPSAYDINIKTLIVYLDQVKAATYR